MWASHSCDALRCGRPITILVAVLAVDTLTFEPRVSRDFELAPGSTTIHTRIPGDIAPHPVALPMFNESRLF
jgi:hypothetical protein